MIFTDYPLLIKPERNCFIACSSEVVKAGRCHCHTQFRCSSVLEKIKEEIQKKKDELRNT